MFLNPTANPMPRRTPSPRVVLPAPPAGGSDRAAAPRRPERDRGGSADRLRDGARPLDHLARRQHVTGAESVQEAKLDRVDAQLGRQQVHLGFGGEHVCTAPNPRIAPQGGLLVYTDVASINALATRYGPTAKEAAFDVTAVELDA